MSTDFLSEIQRDALQEIVNISMGQAADSLARLIETHVQLSIPHITQTNSEDFVTLLTAQQQHLAQQSFWGELNGEMISLISDSGCDALGELMHYDSPLGEQDIQELVLELTNILAGACLQGLTTQLGFKTHLAAPTLLTLHTCSAGQLHWQQALLIEVSFVLTNTDFQSRVLFCLQQDSVGPLTTQLDLLLQ